MAYTGSFQLPRDDMRVMRCLTVCPSVCVSVTFVHSVKTNKDIFKKLFTIGSHTILVFPYQTAWQYSDGDPPDGDVDSRWESDFSRLTLLTIASWPPRTSFAAVCVRPTWTCASSRGPVPVLATGVFPLPAGPAAGSGTACRRNCDGQTVSLVNSVDH